MHKGRYTGMRPNKSWEWPTPELFYEELDREFHFDFDPCPLGGDVDARAPLFSSWAGKRVFCNPPYGPEIPKFLARWKEADIAVFLLPAGTDTRWFHEIVLPHASEIRFIKGRLRFGEHAQPAPFSSIVVIFESQPKRELRQLDKLRKSGHPDQQGIKAAIGDWIVQDAIDELKIRGLRREREKGVKMGTVKRKNGYGCILSTRKRCQPLTGGRR